VTQKTKKWVNETGYQEYEWVKMELTTQEQAMLEGKEGYSVRKSMEILVALG
jgi:hypothetical protein